MHHYLLTVQFLIELTKDLIISVYIYLLVFRKWFVSDLASSGVMFSIDTESGFKDAVYITGAYGLGENVVQGAVNPDQFYVFKPTLKTGFKPILEKKVGSKAKTYDLWQKRNCTKRSKQRRSKTNL